MSQSEAQLLWQQSWNRIVVSQIAPTFLLITNVALLQFGLAGAGIWVRIAALLILLASGILGALAQFSSAKDAQQAGTALGLASQVRYLEVVKFVTPAVFVVIFVAIAAALFQA